MDREFSDELTGLMPVVPHGIAGVACAGCVVAIVENKDVELRCNRCGATVGVIQVDVMAGLLGLDCATAICPHCGAENALPEDAQSYVCDSCGKTISS